MLAFFFNTIRFFCFWLGYFLLLKVLFLLYLLPSHDISFYDTMVALGRGMQHDVSVAGYMYALVALINLLLFTPFRKLHHKLYSYFTIICIAVCSLTYVVDAELYRNWESHIDVSVLQYINTPKEMTASTELSTTLLLIVLFLVTFFVGFWGARKILFQRLEHIPRLRYKYLPLGIILIGASIVPIRGSFSIAPVNTGSVYFASNQFANHLAVNTVWNFIYSVSKADGKMEPLSLIDDEKASAVFDDLTLELGNTPSILKNDTANVVVIMLESFSAKVVGCLGAKNTATPNIDSLAKHGILFSESYAAGVRTNAGVAAGLSGYPSQPKTAIIKYPNKSQQLPGLATSLKKEGYETSFVYGGNANFSNLRSFVFANGFENLIEYNYFPAETNTSKWGVHDHICLDTLAELIGRSNTPFFKFCLTLSSHEPFDVPHNSALKTDKSEGKYLNSVHYTDSVIGAFVRKVEQLPSWDNTVYILIADHGSRLPGWSANEDLLRYKIPMLWLGGALNVTDTVVNTVTSQTDVPATLLSQLGFNSSGYVFSKNVFSDETKSYAFMAYNNGFGFKTDSSYVFYDLTSQKAVTQKGKDALLYGASYYQNLQKDFDQK